MIYFTDENGNLIPFAIDNQGNTELKMDLLWENPSPRNDFTAQTITINNIMDYKLILINATVSWSTANEGGSCFIIPTTNITSDTTGTNATQARGTLVMRTTTGTYIGYRNFYLLPTSITFTDCTGSNLSNSGCIPISIYGIK